MMFRCFSKTRPVVFLLLCLLLCLLLNPAPGSAREVGVIFSGNIGFYRTIHKEFLNELKQKMPGSAEIEFINLFPAPDPVAWSNSAKKLVVKGVELIISYGYPSTEAVLAKESDIPVLYVAIYEPGVSIPKGHATGCSYRIPLRNLLGFYQQVTQSGRLQVIYSSSDSDSVRQANDLAGLAEEMKLDLVRLELNSRNDLPKLDAVGKGDAVLITGTAVVQSMIKEIMSLLSGKNVPVVDIFPDSLSEGAVIALSPAAGLMGQRVAESAVKIMNGERADAIAPVVLEDAELVLNQGGAKKLGLTIPAQLLPEAKRVLE